MANILKKIALLLFISLCTKAFASEPISEIKQQISPGVQNEIREYQVKIKEINKGCKEKRLKLKQSLSPEAQKLVKQKRKKAKTQKEINKRHNGEGSNFTAKQ